MGDNTGGGATDNSNVAQEAAAPQVDPAPATPAAPVQAQPATPAPPVVPMPPVAQRPALVGVAEWCARRSGTDSRVELLAAFHAEQQGLGKLRDTSANFDQAFAAFESRPVS
jgi:hypothetical protein